MDRRSFSAFQITFGILLTATACTTAAGQDHRIDREIPRQLAVIDIWRVLENYHHFEDQMACLRQDFERARSDLMRQRERILNRAKRLNDLDPTSPEYNELERMLHRGSGMDELWYEAEPIKKELHKSEATILWKAYERIQTVVKAYAEQNGIRLVLSARLDPIERSEVDEAMARRIFWGGLDITDEIIARLNADGDDSKRLLRQIVPDPKDPRVDQQVTDPDRHE